MELCRLMLVFVRLFEITNLEAYTCEIIKSAANPEGNPVKYKSKASIPIANTCELVISKGLKLF